MRIDKASQPFNWQTEKICFPGWIPGYNYQACYLQGSSTRNPALWIRDMDNKINVPSLKSWRLFTPIVSRTSLAPLVQSNMMNAFLQTSQMHENLMFEMKKLVGEMVMLRRMRWLGYVARMDDSKMPKQVLLGHLSKARPFHGVKMR